MDVPVKDLGPNNNKLEAVKEGCPLFHCDLYDSEVVHKIAQIFLPGLATACVDNTTGGLFKDPSLVAVDMRKEMVEYLTQRSESYIAESMIQEDCPDIELSEHPTDIISDFIDDFISSKRNLFTRVSSWLLSENREDKIDDIVEEMEINGFWLMDRREAIAWTLLKNVDFKNTFYCKMKFDTTEELAEHGSKCIFRSVSCMNKDCTASFCAVHMEKHDSVCPLKVLPCEQKCSENIIRCEMDRHCITVCPMKLVNCPFYMVGCQCSIPQCMIGKHCQDFLYSHLHCILQIIHKEASEKDLKLRVELLEKSSSLAQLSETQDIRSLIFMVKELEAKVDPPEHVITN
ncbi:PREDICTED: uncharacterized protein LOC104608720 [Nelumbo nucifera]|uniref:Uncharacterized protein LOC104608720 n=2 Tax=Nelumbo nucifera TaxID=4432 RepID=A0A1U8Q8Z8_NELNU|nr:PREDICTED: uncharacterized protein LOC104608720 [Nelumbo nucifera]XP_010273092.1 PREDICTED: uncharacterized protein LOC104608720 [Nelumbo nucifera]XP_019055244.1 PREDICTED: uncharacterized protein LOC104608720 [Nelumbo nucifera]DAD41541.1 TPA_asm: hypothetical protein HUJ06_015864 [Nelumbo nucifera]